MHAQFPLLGEADYVSYVGDLYFKGGANISTHIAEVRYPVQTVPVISVVKLLPADGLSVCNEALAWLFLRAAGIPSPRNAAMLILTEAKAVNVLGRKRVPKNWVSNGYIRAWAAERLDFRSIQALFAGSSSEDRWLAMLQTVQGTAIAAFDEAYLNIDRNTGNILFLSKSSCVPVDHEQCFGQQDWVTGHMHHLNIHGDSVRQLKNGVSGGKVHGTDLQQAYGNMVFHAEKHAVALQACQDHITDLLTRVYPSEGAALALRVLSFLTERTAVNWMKDRLGVY